MCEAVYVRNIEKNTHTHKYKMNKMLKAIALRLSGVKSRQCDVFVSDT